MLWGEAIAKGYACPIWMTYRQASELGGQVRKGEHGSLVVFADRIQKTETADNGDEIAREIPFMKGYTVFNCEQIDRLPENFYGRPSPPLSAPARIEAAEHFAAATATDIRHGGNRAFYAIEADRVQMPPFESFIDPESYYATLLHELTHWTKHPARLNREFGRKRWGDEGYAAEELVAELGAAFLSADLDIAPEPRTDHASYIANWLTVLKNDKRAIFTAAAHAQRAVDFLHGLQRPAGTL
jgi:antirestriction protein ArdC